MGVNIALPVMDWEPVGLWVRVGVREGQVGVSTGVSVGLCESETEGVGERDGMGLSVLLADRLAVTVLVPV